jgi:hypothetical protein
MRFVLHVLSVGIFTAAAFAQVSVTVTSPTNNSRSQSPLKVVASAYSPNGISSMSIFVDSVRVYFQWGDSFTAYLWLKPGWQNMTVQGTDVANNTGVQTLRVFSSSGSGEVSGIEDTTWQGCTAADCAGGQGTSTTYTAAYQTTPSLDGSSRQFNLGGTGRYSNAYWYNFVGGSNTATNFVYDLWAQVDNAAAPQALEFDVNQSFDQKRWVFGTQCNFKGSGKWEVWDGGNGAWVPTSIPCTQWPSNSWVHVQWTVVRVRDSVRYVKLTLNGRDYPVDITLGRQPYWAGSDVDVAVQLDGDANQTGYNIWIDRVKLRAW